MTTAQPTHLPSARPPGDIINQAIGENKKADWLCYALLFVFAIVAIGSVVAVLSGCSSWVAASAGSSVLASAWTFAAAIRMWQSNTALRVLEVTLSDKKEAEKTFKMLREVYLKNAAGPKPMSISVPKPSPPAGGS
ncbi:hypothetical protein J0H58_28885 [bacterium]|nr:hypothetical protein [bacterium]